MRERSVVSACALHYYTEEGRQGALVSDPLVFLLYMWLTG